MRQEAAKGILLPRHNLKGSLSERRTKPASVVGGKLLDLWRGGGHSQRIRLDDAQADDVLARTQQ